MKTFLTLLVLVIGCSFVGINTASGSSSSMRPYYMDELKISNNIEAKGFRSGGRHINVDSVFCSGLRRYGVQSSNYGLDRFWHFSCDADAADGTFYTLNVKTVKSPYSRYWVRVILCATTDAVSQYGYTCG